MTLTGGKRSTRILKKTCASVTVHYKSHTDGHGTERGSCRRLTAYAKTQKVKVLFYLLHLDFRSFPGTFHLSLW